MSKNEKISEKLYNFSTFLNQMAKQNFELDIRIQAHFSCYLSLFDVAKIIHKMLHNIYNHKFSLENQ